jgi:transglutaminase-like putative cysteine protease
VTTETTTDVSRWLATTEFLDHDDPAVQAFARDAVGDATDHREMAVRLFYRVRDGFWYDPYADSGERENFAASHVVSTDRNWCVPKSILLTAAARSLGIPARLGFADVRNHLQSEKLLEKMGTDLFVFHGFSEFLLDSAWVKASPAFNIEMCERFDTKPLEFDGHHDALFHEYDNHGNRHMEYVNQRGSYDDFPYDEMRAAFEEFYPEEPGSEGWQGDEPDEAFAKP